MATADTGTARRSRLRGGLVTLGTVIGLIAAMGLTLFGIGSADHAVADYDASSWLWSSTKSEMARVNGVTGRVDTRLRVPNGQGHTMQVSQTDRFLVLRDLGTGRLSALDLATLQVTATMQTAPGFGVTVALQGDAAFVIDAVQGIVRQLDPRSLAPIGEPVRYPPGIAGGTFDGDGRLWIAVPGEGTVSAVTPAPLPSRSADGGNGGGLSPREVRTVAIAAPSHDLNVSALDNGVAVLDRTTSTLTIVRGERLRAVPLGLAGPGALPARTSGADVPVTVVDDRHLYVVTGDGVHDFAVPGAGPKLSPAVAWAGRFYCADNATGTVYVLDANGKLVDTITVRGANGPLDLEVRENHLFINAPNSSTARVVDDRHRVRVVDKYADDVLGGDPPPAAPPPPPPKPTIGPPSAPRKVTASAGNARARVSWRPAAANGAAITRYVVEADGRTYTVGASQRSLDITGLINGKTYRFTVRAVNAKGAGPGRTSNPVVPTSEVPDPPTAVTAQENKDGTVTVSWPAANGQGRKVVRYQITAVSAGASAPAGESATASLTIAAGDLQYGTQYAFTVVSVNDRGAASKPSPLSNTIVPFTAPGPPRNLAAATVPDQRGAVRATWQAAQDNGRPISRYVVEAGGRSQDVTATAVTLTGFGDGQTVTVKVHAVNEAGAGPQRSATARTIDLPTVTALPPGAPTYNSINVTFSVNDGGSPATCGIAINGGAPTGIGCRGGTITGLWPGNAYGYTVTVTNAAGSASFTGRQSTPALYGQVLCDVPSYCGPGAPGGGIWVYRTPSQNGTAVGDVFAPARYQATCWTTGATTINATPYGGKRSNLWIRIKYSGDNYIPFAWFRLDGGDNHQTLPPC